MTYRPNILGLKQPKMYSVDVKYFMQIKATKGGSELKEYTKFDNVIIDCYGNVMR